jgi:hypothetical protein
MHAHLKDMSSARNSASAGTESAWVVTLSNIFETRCRLHSFLGLYLSYIAPDSSRINTLGTSKFPRPIAATPKTPSKTRSFLCFLRFLLCLCLCPFFSYPSPSLPTSHPSFILVLIPLFHSFLRASSPQHPFSLNFLLLFPFFLVVIVRGSRPCPFRSHSTWVGEFGTFEKGVIY